MINSIRHPSGYGYGIGAVLLWSTVATAFKLALQEVTVYPLLFWSCLISSILLSTTLFVSMSLSDLVEYVKGGWKTWAIMGLINPVLYYAVLFKAYDLLPAQVAQPLNYTWPIVLTVLAIPLLGERPGWRQWCAMAMGFLGIVVISNGGSVSTQSHLGAFGIVLGLSSALLWSLYWLYNIRDPRPAAVKLCMNFIFGTAILASMAPMLGWSLQISFKGALAAGYIGLFEMGITFLLWLKALNRTNSTARISYLIYLVPFLSLLFIHFILGETIQNTTLTGLVLIVTGLILQSLNVSSPSLSANRSVDQNLR
jgi:drug/metabolite transporter (DMT)-like permease